MAEPEDAEEFKARIQKMVDRYEAQFLPQKERKVTLAEVRKMDEGARRWPVGFKVLSSMF